MYKSEWYVSIVHSVALSYSIKNLESGHWILAPCQVSFNRCRTFGEFENVLKSLRMTGGEKKITVARSSLQHWFVENLLNSHFDKKT